MTHFTAVQLDWDKNVCVTGEERVNMHMTQIAVQSKWALVPAKLSSEMISLIANTELVQYMFIARHTINIYGSSCD